MADVGRYIIRDAIHVGICKVDEAVMGRDVLELEIADRFPDAEYCDTSVVPVWHKRGRCA